MRIGWLHLVLGCLVLTAPGQLSAQTILKFGYGDYQSPPYAYLDGGRLTGGIMHDIGELLSSELNVTTSYLPVPRKRLSLYLERGEVDMRCHLSPKWLKSADSLIWSQPLYSVETVIAAPLESVSNYTNLAALQGRRLGGVLGYRYSSEIEKMIQEGKIVRMDSPGMRNSLRMLNFGRVDMVIGTRRLLQAEIRELGLEDKISLGPLVVRSQQVACAISPEAGLAPDLIRQAVDKLIADGAITAILARYRGS